MSGTLYQVRVIFRATFIITLIPSVTYYIIIEYSSSPITTFYSPKSKLRIINLTCLIRKVSIKRNRVTINHPVVACHGKSQFFFQCGGKNGHVSSEFFATGTGYSRSKLFGSSDVAFITCFLGDGYTGIILCA